MADEKMDDRYQKCCRRFVAKCTVWLLLQILGIGGYAAIVIYPVIVVILNVIARQGAQAWLLFIFPLIFTVFALIASLNAWRYGRALVRLLKGNVLVEVGYLAWRDKNQLVVAEKYPCDKQPAVRRLTFYLRNPCCTGELQIGDKIKVIYPCDRSLQVRSTVQRWAIYACRADCSPDTAITSDAKKTIIIYITLVTLMAVPLLSVLIYLIHILLRQTFLA